MHLKTFCVLCMIKEKKPITLKLLEFHNQFVHLTVVSAATLTKKIVEDIMLVCGLAI